MTSAGDSSASLPPLPLFSPKSHNVHDDIHVIVFGRSFAMFGCLSEIDSRKTMIFCAPWAPDLGGKLLQVGKFFSVVTWEVTPASLDTAS